MQVGTAPTFLSREPVLRHGDRPGLPLGFAPAIVVGHRREQVIAVTGIYNTRNTAGPETGRRTA